MTVVRVRIRVRPNATRTEVGGVRNDALLVAVSAPAVDGRANEAVIAALAEALGVRRRQITLVSGLRSRDKVVEIAGAAADLEPALDRLRRR